MKEHTGQESTGEGVLRIGLEEYFSSRHLGPNRRCSRYDATLELTWHVDDCDDRYVRLTSSVEGDDCVLVSRDLRVVEACVLQDQEEIFRWVRSHLVSLSKSSLNHRYGASGTEGRT
jgi:hypothetical protein